jgi:Malonyl-CoA decarboxylase C-terminal domain
MGSTHFFFGTLAVAGRWTERSQRLSSVFHRRSSDPTVPPTTHGSALWTTPSQQQQQIRTYVRPKRKKRFQKFLQWKAAMQRKGLKYPHHPKYKDRPVDFRTQVTRLLAKATRGAQTKWFLRDFVRRYPTYSQDKRYTHVIPYLSGSFRQRAFQSFFARILREITVENNEGTNGFVWLMQFREDLMDLIFQRVEELKTLAAKVKLMRLRLRQLDAMKWQIRQDMADYLYTRCSQPLPEWRSTPTAPGIRREHGREEESAPPTRVQDFSPESAPTIVEDFSQEVPPTRVEDFSQEVPPEYRSGPALPPPPPLDEIPLDSELLESDAPRVLGCIRRLHYSDLSISFLKRYAREEPFLAARFRGTNKRVYGWFRDETSVHPDVIVYVAFLETVPKTVVQALVEQEQVNSPPATLGETVPETIEPDANVEEQTAIEKNAPPPKWKVAAFYGATILHRALENTGIAEYCERPILRMLREDEDTPSSISVFSALSPIYSFRRWLLEKDYEDDITLLVVNETSDDFLTLAREWDCPNDQVFGRMKSLLDRNYESYREAVGKNPVVATAMDNLLLRCASSYIVKGKTPVVNWRCDPLELSTRYHVAHGASVFRLNLASDPTEAGWMESFGIGTNFIYDLEKMESNQKKFNKLFSAIDFHDNVTRYVPKPRKLQLTKEQRERWIPMDPVRKKMIELSQNGKLFRVPLYGPPTLNRKKTVHPSLVPPRIRPSSRLPPPVPTVGVSGLSITLKPPEPLGPSVPSYVARTLPGGIRKVGEGLQRRGREPSNYWPEEVEFGHIEEVKRPAGKKGKKTKSRS